MTNGIVGRTLSFSVTVTQEAQPLASNALTGVVTSVGDLSTVGVGDALYSVGSVPVRAVAGTTPFWRDLTRDVRGVDVEQLQEALRELTLLRSPVNGVYGPSTERAVRAWQRELGIEETGTVRLGELIAVPSLPASLQIGADVRRGLNLSGGEDAVLGFTADRRFSLVLTEDQERLVPSSAAVRVTHDGITWDAVIASSEIDGTGNVTMMLTAPDGGPVCADQCAALPVTDRLTLRADVIIVPEVHGAVVPAAAVRTGTDGSAYVLTADKTRVAVRALAGSGGVVAVEGVEIGTVVLLSEPPGE